VGGGAIHASCCDAGNGNGRSSSPFTPLKAALLAPIARARIRMDTAAKPGSRPSRVLQRIAPVILPAFAAFHCLSNDDTDLMYRAQVSEPALGLMASRLRTPAPGAMRR
jgi:hypothetical protein